MPNISPLQWIGIVILFNSTLLGGASQLGDLSLNPGTVKAILAVATMGNGFLGGLVTMFGSQGNMIKSAAAITGDDGRPAVRVSIGANASPAAAAVAVDAAQPNVGASTPDARAVLQNKAAS